MSAIELSGIDVDRLDGPINGRPVTVRAAHLSLVTDAALTSRCVGWRWHAKRMFDVTVVLLVLPIALAVMALLAVVTKLASPGPTLFGHERIGRGGTPFRMFKFRTMYTDSLQRLEADAALHERYVTNDYKIPAGEDPRIVPFGRFLRASSLDELPQLFNVLKGDMSLVGPRPVVEEELRSYASLVGAYTYVRPGITGRWQTEGRNEIHYPERALLDAEYVERFRLRSDVVIMCKTLPCVLRRAGVR